MLVRWCWEQTDLGGNNINKHQSNHRKHKDFSPQQITQIWNEVLCIHGVSRVLLITNGCFCWDLHVGDSLPSTVNLDYSKREAAWFMIASELKQYNIKVFLNKPIPPKVVLGHISWERLLQINNKHPLIIAQSCKHIWNEFTFFTARLCGECFWHLPHALVS